jgi:hypothetical protein
MKSHDRIASTLGIAIIALFLIPLIEAGSPVKVDPLTWKEAKPSIVPGVRICSLMVYDSESDVILQFGGFDGKKASRELWAYDCNTNTWENLSQQDGPKGRYGHGFIYDEGRDRSILFFGTASSTIYYNDMWEYDYNTRTWKELKPSVVPSPRCKGGCGYDIESDRIVFFGGFGMDQVNNAETWTYDHDENIWVNETPDVSPSPRMRNPMIYDEKADRIVLFGGWKGGNEVLGDTWAYDVDKNAWQEMNPSQSPAPRARYGRAYLPSEGVVLITGGFGGEAGDLNDTWLYDHGANEWTKLVISGGAMQSRHCFQIALDTESGIIMAMGGAGAESYKDTWLLNPYEAEEADDGGPSLATYAMIGGVILIIIIIIAIVVRSFMKG